MLKSSAVLIPVLVLAAFADPHPQHQNTNQQTAAPQQSGIQQQTSQQNADNGHMKPAATPRLEFEVASIKSADPKEPGQGIKVDPGGETMHAQNATVRLMIRTIWRIEDTQIVGAPDWVGKDLWDVEAKADGPHSRDDLRTMYQNMMIDRFKMQFHWDTRDLPMLALVVDKSGPKLTASTDPEPCHVLPLSVASGNFQAKHCDLLYFTWIISQFPWVGRPVVDETGLDKSSSYDFTLTFGSAPETLGTAERGSLPPDPGADFFRAIREQLGLRLEAKKGPVPVMVIDHIEKPSSSDN